jgi:hypothetical protein
MLWVPEGGTYPLAISLSFAGGAKGDLSIEDYLREHPFCWTRERARAEVIAMSLYLFSTGPFSIFEGIRSFPNSIFRNAHILHLAGAVDGVGADGYNRGGS